MKKLLFLIPVMFLLVLIISYADITTISAPEEWQGNTAQFTLTSPDVVADGSSNTAIKTIKNFSNNFEWTWNQAGAIAMNFGWFEIEEDANFEPNSPNGQYCGIKTAMTDGWMMAFNDNDILYGSSSVGSYTDTAATYKINRSSNGTFAFFEDGVLKFQWVQTSNKTVRLCMAAGAGATASDVNWTNFTLPIPDTIVPIVNVTFNISQTNIRQTDVLNISANITDETGLSTANITINFTTGKVFFNYTLSGTSINIHNITEITDPKGTVLNITVFVTDTSNNVKQNSTKFTVINFVPQSPTIILPTPNDFNNTQPDYPFNITFPADADGDTITISYYINGKLNQTSAFNVTFNASDGFFILNVSLSDGIASGPNATVNFTIDTTIPTLLNFNLTNNTIFGFNINATMNITMFDTNPFLLQFNWHNASISNIYNVSNMTTSTATTITIIFDLNLTGLASGNYTLDINFSDRSTVFAIDDYVKNTLANGFNYRTAEGNDITIVQTFGSNPDRLESVKKLDRYTFEFGTTKTRETRKYLVIADNKIHIPRYQDHKGHLIVSEGIGGNWISFDNNDPESVVTLERLGENMVLVTVFSNDFNFKSIGGLNVVNVFYNFQVDNDPPFFTNFKLNNTLPLSGDPVNISVNCNDLIGISTCFIGLNDTGDFVNVTNITASGDTTLNLSHHFILTVTASEGQTVGALACGNDTFNQFSCSNIITLQVNDTTVPTIVTGNNATRFLNGTPLNFTYNVTDNSALKSSQVFITENSVTRIFNFSLVGTSAEFSQNFTIAGTIGTQVNVTAIVNDTFNNKARVETLFTITKDLFVNATNLYDNTTILTFEVVIANSTFNSRKTTTSGLLNFSDIVSGLFEVNVSSNAIGGYFNVSTPNFNVSKDFEARMFQAIVYFTANIRGTAFNVTEFNISVPRAVNQSNVTGELRLLLNASNYTISGKSNTYFDIQKNITVGERSISRFVANFYDMNISISIFSVANSSFVKNFTIALTGTDFTETLKDENKGNITFSLGNNTYTFFVSHPRFATTAFSFTVLSNTTYHNLTFSILGLNSINFTVFDELTERLLPENATISIVTDTFATNLTAVNGILYIQDLVPAEYRITTQANKYHQRDFYVSVLNASNQTVDLYLLSTTNGTEVTFTVQDNSGNDLENATIRLKRFYTSSASYRTVAMSRTNSEGDTVIDVDFNDAFYETFTTFKEFTLRTIGARMISTTLILTLNLLADPFETIDIIDGITTSLTFNNLTQTFSYVFTDLGGINREGTLTVIEITPTTETILCTSTDTSSGATLICQINTTNTTGSVVAKGFIKVGSNNILTNTKEILGILIRDLKDIWGTQGVFFTILIAGTLGTLGALVSPSVGIIMFIVSLIVVNLLGMTILSATMYGFFIIIAGVIIYKMKN